MQRQSEGELSIVRPDALSPEEALIVQCVRSAIFMGRLTSLGDGVWEGPIFTINSWPPGLDKQVAGPDQQPHMNIRIQSMGPDSIKVTVSDSAGNMRPPKQACRKSTLQRLGYQLCSLGSDVQSQVSPYAIAG
jgi:hypothetical protein